MTRPVSWRSAAAAIAVAGIAAACSSSADDSTNTTSAGSGSQVQALPTLAFSPTSLVVAVNANVTWVFGSVGHTVTFDSTAGAPANIGTPDAGISNSSVTRTFTTAGTYYYHCSIHTSMTGAITVGSNGVVPPPPPPPPPPPAGYLKTKP